MRGSTWECAPRLTGSSPAETYNQLMTLAALAILAVASTGPNPGEKVPDFTLPDQSGQFRSLASLQGPKGLVLLFFRSADW